MDKKVQISEAEFEVMKVVWEHSPVSTNEIVHRLTISTDWNDGTIRTLLNRLVKKGALAHTKDSRVYVYTPTFTEDEYIKGQNKSFMDKFYGGDLKTMLLSLIDTESPNDEELDALMEKLKERQAGEKE